MATDTSVLQVSQFPPLGSYELVKVVEAGLPLETLELLRERGLTFTEVGQLVIPPRTVKHRKARGERLTSEETERLLRVVRVLDLADHVFGKREKALGWLRTRDERNQDEVSLHLLKTETGARLVEGQLWGIAEGMFS